MAVPSPSRDQTSMHRWASIHSELLWIYDGPFASNIPNQQTDHRQGYWVWLLRKGRVRVRMGNQAWEAGEGQWIICPQGIATQEFSQDARILSVRFLCQWPTGENLFFERQACVFDSGDFPVLARIGSALCQLVQQHLPGAALDISLREVDYNVYLRVHRLFCRWLVEFHRVWRALDRKLAHAEGGDDRWRRAIRCLNESPLGEDFPETLLLRETGLGRASLDRLFVKHQKLTARKYWEFLREKSALHYLQSDDLSIKEIGYQLGFKQASHFTKWFSRRVGLAPNVYRKRGAGSWIV